FNLFGELALVEGLALRGCDFLEDLRVRRPLEALSREGRAALRQECVGEPGLVLQLRHLVRPLPGDGRGDEESLAAVFDRLLAHALERQLAQTEMQLRSRGETAL